MKSKRILTLVMAAALVLAASLSFGQVCSFDCKNASDIRIEKGECGEDQTSSDIHGYDYENGSGYCDPGFNRFTYELCACPDLDALNDQNATYRIQATILTPGVYWGNDNVSTGQFAVAGAQPGPGYVRITNYNATELICENDYVDMWSLGWAECAFDDTVLGAGALIDDADDAAEKFCTDCLPDLANVIRTTNASFADFFGFGGNTIMTVDLPVFYVNPNEVAPDTEIQVEVCILKVGEPDGLDCDLCDTPLCCCTKTIAIYGCEPGECSVCFPYVTAIDDPSFFVGLAITNYSDADGPALITFNAGGTTATMERTVPAGSVDAFLLGDLSASLAAMGLDTSARGFVQVDMDFNGDAFTFIGDGTMAQGYLPRDGECDGCTAY